MSNKVEATFHGAPESTPLSRVSAYLEARTKRAEANNWARQPIASSADLGVIHPLEADDVQAIVDELVLTRARVVSALDLAELADLAHETFELAEGDSNDDEIEGLQSFRDAALSALGIAVAHD